MQKLESYIRLTVHMKVGLYVVNYPLYQPVMCIISCQNNAKCVTLSLVSLPDWCLKSNVGRLCVTCPIVYRLQTQIYRSERLDNRLQCLAYQDNNQIFSPNVSQTFEDCFFFRVKKLDQTLELLFTILPWPGNIRSKYFFVWFS